MRVFLTGSKGKIGSVVHTVLTEAGHEVVSFDLADGHDIMDAAAVSRAMAGCDAVAHLAMAMGRDRYRPEETFASGTVGTWHVLQAAEAHGVRRIATYSSVNAMGIFRGEDVPDYLPFDEDHDCRPGTPYGISKLLGEQVCRHFTRRTGISTVCIRPPAVWTDADIERIRAERERDADAEWTPYWEYGCYIYVEDLARATLCALTCDDPGHVPLLVVADDIASSRRTGRELARQLLPDVEWRGDSDYDQDPFRALVVNSRARQVLGWTPRYRWRD